MATTAETMVTSLETFLASNVGVTSLNIDGVSVSYSRAQAMRELAYWKSRVTRETGARPRVATFDLGGFVG
jgi:archaellin